MRIARRLFVVPLANNNHGKTTLITTLVSQGLGRALNKNQKSDRVLISPWGRNVDAYVYGRSYQETEKSRHTTVEASLAANDRRWRFRELIIMPSHVSDIDNSPGPDDIEQMIEAAHGAGFDAICASIHFTGSNEEDRTAYSSIWRKRWDERWTLPNPYSEGKYDGPLDALGCDLWTWICRRLAS